MNQAIRFITFDFVSKQSYSLFQVNLEQSEVFSLDFESIYSKFTIEIQSLKYGEYVISNIVFFYKQWVLENNEYRVKNIFNNFKQVRQKLPCAFEFVMNPEEINNLVEQELLQQSSNAFNFAIAYMQVQVKEQARFQIPYLDESYINDGGISVKLQKYIQNSTLDNNSTADNSSQTAADQKQTMVLKYTLNFLDTNAVNFDNLIVSFKYLQGQVILLDGDAFINLKEIIFSQSDIFTDIKNSTLLLRSLEKVIFHNINFQGMQQIETPSSGMGVITIDNVQSVVIDGANFTDIQQIIGRGSFLRVTNSINVEIKNINFKNITCIGYSANNLQQFDQPTTNFLNYFLHFENVTNLSIQYINVNDCKWKNFYFLRAINIFNVAYFNNSQITQQFIQVNQTLDQILQQGYSLNQNCKINGIFANQISQNHLIQVNMNKQRQFKQDDSIYQNYNLFICLPQSFISFFQTQGVNLSNILIDDLQLNAVEFDIFNFIQTNQILSDNMTFSNIFQNYLQNPPLAQAINVQGSQQFEISNSVFEKNSNIRFIFTPNLPISQAEQVQNQFVKFNNIQVRNSQHFACLIEGSAYDNVIINSYFYNLINGQTLKQIQELQSNNQYIYYTKQPNGVVGLYSIHSLLLKNNIFLSCKSYSSAAVYLSQGYIVQFISNKFEANQALNTAGAVNIQNVISITLVNCIFSLNKAIESYGGAIIIQQSQVYSFINNIFQGNQAKKDSAGAIQLISSDIQTFYGNHFENNQAAIGGCMRFQFTLPSFIDSNNTYLQNNTFKNNKASLYGDNLASDPQGIALVEQNFDFSQKNNTFNNTQNYTIINQISGDYLEFPLKIILTDQDMFPIIFPYSLYLLNLNNMKEFNQSAINQNENPNNNFPVESDSITQQFSSYQIQVIPDPSMHIDESSITTIYDFKCQCYVINFSLSAKPLFNSSFQIQTKNSYYISDFTKSPPQLLFQPLSLTVNVEFGKCLPGDILVFSDQIVSCQPCPSGKYTLVDISDYTQYDSDLQLDQSLQQCKICPEQAVSCEKNIINLKNGYWRLNNMTDQIFDCQDSSQSCLPEDPNSREGCKIGYIGIYCAECDYRAKLWNFQYGRFYDQDCQTCNQINQWYNIMFIVVILIFLFIYNYMQVNRQRKFAKKSCISYYLRKFNFMLIGKSGLIDHGAVYTKIFINYLQIMFLLFSNKLKIPIFRQILQLLGGDPLQLQYASMDCIVSNFSSLPIYVNKVLFQQLLPLTILALCILVLVIQKNISQRRKCIQKKYIFPSIRDFKAQGLFIYLFYSPSFLIKLISYMFCSSTSSFSHLVGDHSYSCFTTQHQGYFYFLLLPLFIFWSFIFPLTVIYILRKNSDKLQYIWIKQSYGFLYQEYNDKKYFWEFVKIYMKILIMVVVIAFNNDLSLRYVIVIFILFIYFLITLQANPYITKDLNYCDRISNLTIILSVIIDLFLNQSSSSSFVFQQVNQIIIMVINCLFLLLILKRLILKPLPFSYQEMNLFQKMIYKLRNSFPTLFSFVQFQPQNPFNIFRNWKRLKLIIQNFQEMRKSRNLFNDQFFKTFQQTRFYGGPLNEIISNSSQKSEIESLKIRERQPIHLSSLPCNMSIEDFDQQDNIQKGTKKGQFIKTVKTEPYDATDIQLGSVEIKNSEKHYQNKLLEEFSVFEDNLEREQQDKNSLNDTNQQKFISIFKLNRKGFEDLRSNFSIKNQEQNQDDQSNFTNFYEIQSPSSFYQNEQSCQNIKNQSSVQDHSLLNQLKFKSISQLNQQQSSHKFNKA